MSDPDVPAMKPEPYDETTAENYASDFVTSITTTTPIRRGVLLRGRCPRCGDTMDFPIITKIFQRYTRAGDVASGGGSEERPVLCTCSVAHPGRPDGDEGCGAYWNVTLSSTTS
jgi:hypothetical protein